MKVLGLRGVGLVMMMVLGVGVVGADEAGEGEEREGVIADTLRLVAGYWEHDKPVNKEAFGQLYLQADAENFNGTDADGDGEVSWEEWQAGGAEEAGKLIFEAQDKNDDGVLEKDEVKRGFRRMDGNKDKVVDEEEYEAFLGKLRKRSFGKWDADGNGGVSAGEYAERSTKFPLKIADKIFEKLDDDGDGDLSVEDLESKAGGF